VIDFRYHIVSIVAVFLALALGLFLGSTTLQSTVTRSLHHQANLVTKENRTAQAKNDVLSSELHAERGFTAAVEPYAVSEKLDGDTVALVSAPGVDGALRKSLTATLEEAGASVTADVQLQSSYLDPTQDAELGALAAEIPLPGHTLPSGNGASQVSALLADVLLVRPGHHPLPRSRVDGALSALSVGKFISVNGDPPDRPANLAVLLVPAPDPSVAPTLASAQNTVLLGLAADLRGQSSGTVIGGPNPVAGDSGSALVAARADSTLTKRVSTVDFDISDPAAGRIAVVLALAVAPSGTVGQYGLAQTPPLPSPSPSPSP
jgi:Copper transport outer membrane protein, MctB